MARDTIADIVVKVLESSGGTMTAKEIYDSIISQQLYEFKAKDRFAVVHAQLNKHCAGNLSKAASPRKLFTKVGEKYSLC